MPTTLIRHRQHAYDAQFGLCFYCRLPMWVSHPEVFAKANGITLAQAHLLKCTAEHLVAREDGGKNTKENIVAACWCCNQRRHRRKQAQSPLLHRQWVQDRLSIGKWHEKTVVARLRDHSP